MNVVFYKGPEGFFGWSVRKWTRSPYSHCELEFSDGALFSAHPEGGVRWRKPLTPQQEKNWDRVPVHPLYDDKIKAWCMMQFGDRYDWAGIFFSQVIPLDRHAASRWFCSELCVSALQQGGILENVVPQSVSPGRLYKLLT